MNSDAAPALTLAMVRTGEFTPNSKADADLLCTCTVLPDAMPPAGKAGEGYYGGIYRSPGALDAVIEIFKARGYRVVFAYGGSPYCASRAGVSESIIGADPAAPGRDRAAVDLFAPTGRRQYLAPAIRDGYAGFLSALRDAVRRQADARERQQREASERLAEAAREMVRLDQEARSAQWMAADARREFAECAAAAGRLGLAVTLPLDVDGYRIQSNGKTGRRECVRITPIPTVPAPGAFDPVPFGAVPVGTPFRLFPDQGNTWQKSDAAGAKCKTFDDEYHRFPADDPVYPLAS